MYDFAVFLITAFSLYLFLTACLPFSVSLFRKFIYFVFTCIVVALLSPYGQITAFFGIFILIITLPFFASTPRLLTMCCSLWGYICAVVLSHRRTDFSCFFYGNSGRTLFPGTVYLYPGSLFCSSHISHPFHSKMASSQPIISRFCPDCSSPV